MSTSGVITYNMTAQGIVTFALKLINITDRLETPAAEDMASGIEALNLMLKSWQMNGPNLWRKRFGSVTLVADTASYTLSPRPYSVEEARYRSASGVDLPMNELNREEYVELPLKTSTGIPTNFYIDRQRASVIMYVWPVPASVTTETIQYTYQSVIEDISAQTNDIDIPQEWFETVGYNLAARLAEQFNIEKADLVTRRAEQLLALAENNDREPFIQFRPSLRG